MGQRIFECVLSIGTRSAQSIMASGFTAAQTGRTHDRTRPMLQQLRKFLPRRRRPHMTKADIHRPHTFVRPRRATALCPPGGPFRYFSGNSSESWARNCQFGAPVGLPTGMSPVK
jgi:hypothetical protein